MMHLSAAFDTIDHSTLLKKLESLIGVSGKAMDWFKSYITGHKQSVLINQTEPSLFQLNFGVPQGSILALRSLI